MRIIKIVPSRMKELFTSLAISKKEFCLLLHCSSCTLEKFFSKGGNHLNFQGVYNLLRISEDAVPFIAGDVVSITVNRGLLKRIIRESNEAQLHECA